MFNCLYFITVCINYSNRVVVVIKSEISLQSCVTSCKRIHYNMVFCTVGFCLDKECLSTEYECLYVQCINW